MGSRRSWGSAGGSLRALPAAAFAASCTFGPAAAFGPTSDLRRWRPDRGSRTERRISGLLRRFGNADPSIAGQACESTGDDEVPRLHAGCDHGLGFVLLGDAHIAHC